MPIVPFAEFRPDLSDFSAAGKFTKNIANVVPHGDGYGPFKSLATITSSAAAPCRGFFYARKADGSVSAFMGTSTKLYQLDNTTLQFNDVSKALGTYSALSNNANWTFEQFNKYVIATQVNVPPQYFSLTTSTDFKDITGSPPQAAYVTVVNRFLVLSGIASPNVYRVQWSDLNDIFNWSSGQADFQDLPDGGIVRGIAGGESGVIFQDSSIRRMIFSPGSPYVFGIERISKDIGLYAPYSIIGSADRVFFIANDGFKMLLPGSSAPEPIGKERVDRFYFNTVDTGNLQLTIGAVDPTKTRVYWGFRCRDCGAQDKFDQLLIYDYALKVWSFAESDLQYIGQMSAPGATLEGLDTLYSTTIDSTAFGIPSFDVISGNSGTQLSGFDTNGRLGFFNGINLAATLETGEQDGDGRIIFVNGIRPITDAKDISVEVSHRMAPQNATTYTTPADLNTETGMCNTRVEGRYIRAKASITGGSTWSYAAGVEPDFTLSGQR